jgi:hypothetical protein
MLVQHTVKTFTIRSCMNAYKHTAGRTRNSRMRDIQIQRGGEPPARQHIPQPDKKRPFYLNFSAFLLSFKFNIRKTQLQLVSENYRRATHKGPSKDRVSHN